jgi:hypothetical protein
MPDVAGQRLDVALSDLEGVGVGEGDVEIVGGGVFGVIDESGWTVCTQGPMAGSVAEHVRVIVDRSCQGEAVESATASALPSPVPSSPSALEDTTAVEADSEQDSVAEADTFRMPRLVGHNLQAAQDELQAHGSYLMDQQDASGLGRFQLLDSNWVVCAQNPAAGNRVPLDRIVTLSAVKLGELCS